MLHETGEGIADWSQDPLKCDFAGETVWLSGRLHPSHNIGRFKDPATGSQPRNDEQEYSILALLTTYV